LEFESFWIITRCLAGSEIFFLDKQSETCPKNSAPKKSFLSFKYKISHNHHCMPHFARLIAILYDILCYLEFESFRIITRCLARSEIFFLDKQSETCQKKFCPQEIITFVKIYNISELLLYAIYIEDLVHFTWYIMLFGIWVFLDNHKVPCEIWNIFPWQTIWYLSKKFCSQEIITPFEKYNILKITILVVYSCIIHYSGRFIALFGIWEFLDDHQAPCEIWDIFPGQKIWDLSNKFQLWRN